MDRVATSPGPHIPTKITASDDNNAAVPPSAAEAGTAALLSSLTETVVAMFGPVDAVSRPMMLYACVQ